ncbi:WD repeat-containing protein 75-like [Oppia nitens]|uniref:WD repeat-containing protein 75-like n=1 Tax=Oppia nitens TaxID=1686743 RepID=UPI0023DBCB5B|nr:WD repeat-containing protein 75-like [Oppia nitens]
MATPADGQTSSYDTRSDLLVKIGGHNLVDRKPVFTNDSKYLLVASGNQLRRYVVETGAYLTSHDLGHECNIISIHLVDTNSDELVVISSDGLVIIWNLNENHRVNDINLSIDLTTDKIIWAKMVSNYIYFLRVHTDEQTLQSNCQLFYCPKNNVQQKMVFGNAIYVTPGTNSVTFCPMNSPQYCVTIDKNILYVSDFPVKKSLKLRRHLTNDDKQFTCVVSHPTEPIIATGDTIGRITIWADFADSNYPSRSIMHWHQFRVPDLCFSAEGSALYSGGAEMTLIRWDITGTNFGQKNFLPRLGMSIKYVTIDYNRQLIAITHEDNTIQLLDSQMKGIKCVIEGMTLATGKDCGLTTGLLWNSKMKAITLNSRTGHLQFFSPHIQRQLFHLDVVNQNLISNTDEVTVFPTELTKAAVSDDGLWLSTLEMRDDFETLPEIRLKFWQIKETLKNYILNTTIHLPHKSIVNCLKFASNSQSMVSTSKDKEFKVWNLVKDDDKEWWNCFKVGNLNSISIPTLANWSADSSLLAVVYDNYVTLWDICDKLVLRFMTKLSVEDKNESTIIFVEFGRQNKSHFLIEGRQTEIKVWNLLDLSVLWKYQLYERIVCIDFNQWENKLAVTTNRIIQFMSIDSDDVIATVDLSQSQQSIIATVFTDEMPNNVLLDNKKPTLEKTQFYCMNSSQELFVLSERRSQMSTQVMSWQTDDYLSPIAAMLMNKKERKETLKNDEFDSYFKTNLKLSKLVNDMFFNVPSHVLPPIDILSKTFLTALNKCKDVKQDIKDERYFKTPSDFDIKPSLALSYDNQSDNQSNSTNLDTNERESDVKYMTVDDLNEELNEFIDEDYSWLKQLDSSN